MTPEILTLKLDTLAYGGDALGRLEDGRLAFVPFALPGETVRARVVEQRRGHARLALVEVLQASPQRIQPCCIHFGQCGGCAYQHLSHADQLAFKTAILGDQLRRIGKILQPPLGQAVASPGEWYYRNQLQFHLTREGKLAFIGVDGHSRLPIRECHLPEPALGLAWPGLEFEPGLGLERITLRLGAQDDLLLVLESPEPPELETEAGLSVVHLLDDEAVVMAGEESLAMEVNGRSFQVSAGAFFQVNTPVAGRMVTHLLERLPVDSRTTLLDVYCGVGLFSAFFAARVGRLVGVELSPAACADFAVNLDEFDNVELYQAPAEEVLPHLDIHPDLVLLDPPRAGLDKRVLDALLAQAPARLAYISCDPSTLARDAARLLAGGYRLVEITLFDMFPQTYHLESISIFARGE